MNHSSEPVSRTPRQAGVLTLESSPAELAKLAGGKGHNLFRLSRAGFNVPRWAVVGADVLDAFTDATGLNEVILGALRNASAANSEEVAASIFAAFARTELNGQARSAIAAAYGAVGEGSVAVRSSGLDEDGAARSFAGQFDSLLNVSGDDALYEAVKRCWASAYSGRAIAYRLAHGLPLDAVRMAVVVQRMVASDRSGVVFTANPTSGRTDEVVIGAVYGLGESLVSGAVDADTLVVDAATCRIKDATVGAKQERLDPAPHGGCTKASVPVSERDRQALSQAEVEGLCGVARDIASQFGGPQDIEWAIVGGRLWVLQTRPITGLRRQAPAGESGPFRIWDNSNIIESFGATTSPLTYTFGRHVYHVVYREFCSIVGVPPQRLAEMDPWLENMLGYFNGHVYYNILNWYRVIRLLPLYAVHRKALEVSIGLEEPLDEETAMAQRPLGDPTWQTRAIEWKIALRFLAQFMTVERSADQFLRHFNEVFVEFEAIDHATLSANDLYGRLRRLESELLVQWGRMIVLEASIGLSYGVLHVLTKRWLPEAPGWFLFQAVRPQGEVESARPAARLLEIAHLVHANAALRKIIEETPRAEIGRTLDALEDSEELRRFRAAVADYIRDFAYRSINELKLEEPDLRQDPTILYSMLTSAMAQARAQGKSGVQQAATPTADGYLDVNLRGPRRALYERVRAKVRRGLSYRESVRFARSRVFGLARRIFTSLGEALAGEGVVDDPRDIFQLRFDEIRGYFEGTVIHEEVRPLAAMRKSLANGYRGREAPSRFVTRGTPYLSDAFRSAWSGAGSSSDSTPSYDATSDVLQGTGCCPGSAEGEVRVVQEPHDVGGKVLVTYRTDPGWIAVLPSAAAILIERGSPLTHVAVVARELGIPTIVQVRDMTKRLQNGMRVHVDGASGKIRVLDFAGRNSGVAPAVAAQTEVVS